MAAGRKGLKDVQGIIAKKLAAISPAGIRKDLNTQRTHFIPLNIPALKVTLGGIIKPDSDSGVLPADAAAQVDLAIQQFVAEIIAFLESTTNKITYEIHLSSNQILAGRKGSLDVLGSNPIQSFLPAKIYQNNILQGLLFLSYDNTYENLFAAFLNKQFKELIFGLETTGPSRASRFIKYEKYLAGPGDEITDPTERQKLLKIQEAAINFKEGKDGSKAKGIGFDIGHLLSNTPYEYIDDNGNTQKVILSTSPQAERIRKVLAELNTLMRGAPNNLQALQAVKTKIEQVQNRLYTNSTYGPQVEITLTKEVKDFLAKTGALVVIIQERLENQVLFGSQLEAEVGNEILQILLDMGFSSSLVEDVTDIIGEILQTGKTNIKTTGRKKTKFTTTKKPVSFDQRGPIKILAPASKTKGKTINRPSSPVLADSAIKLQNLLNQKLVETVKQNMGGGNRRDILNLRTGRFAESVKAQRVSQSRRGMISVFYSYMRNPYATFSAGGEQSRPSSRDPKLLISKSIRQIAAELMITNLRSIDS